MGYLVLKNQANCHMFQDFNPDADNNKSFTLSYAVKGASWVFFHDYFPDFYMHTRERLYNLKDQSVYQHNDGQPGHYHEGTGTKPYFIDVVFKAGFDMVLETVNWVSEFLQNDTDQPFNTLTHIAIWNSTQHTGRVPLSKLQKDKTLESRRTRGEWSFNDFRDILITKGNQFLQDIFHDYALQTAAADAGQAWYKKELLIDSWFCVRFEFDNVLNSSLILHETTLQAIKSDR
jgi:hypothetical protein